MAHPTVEKLKSLGLRHGEKAVVGLAVTLFLVFVILAVGKKTIQMTPEELAEKAKSAESNLSKEQKEEDILTRIEAAGVKPATEFEQIVDKTQAKSLNPAEFVVKNKWVTPEPGAGLIRDQPVLLAVEDLYTFPNRGGYLVYELDAKGERIVDDGKSTKSRTGAFRRRSGMMGSGSSSMAMMMSGMSGGGGAMTPKQKEQAEAKIKQDEARLKTSLVGKAQDKPEDAKKADAMAAPQVNYKETVKGYRSVVITGTLDNKKLKENYLAALKDSAIANPNFRRVDVERQMLQSNGKWTEFAAVDSDANLRVLDNLPEVDEELVPEAPGPRLETLVDPLPFPKAGFWEGVHIANLVPKEKREIARPTVGGMGGYGMGMMGGGSSSSSAMMAQMMMGGGGQSYASSMAKSGSSSSSNMMAMMKMGSGSGYGGMGSSGGAAPAQPTDETDFPKSESDELMVRSIDFTVKPDNSYRYRVRVVVVNPNYLRNDVSPGTDTDSTDLKGPWSDPSPEVTVPPDVAAYAMLKTPPARRRDQVTFQVVRWNPEDGRTVVRNDEAGPGELIGNPASTDVPLTDGRGKKSQIVDFNSHRFVLDSMGGIEPLPSTLKAGPTFAVPALSLLVRPDGMVAVHTQAQDATDEFRIKMEQGYQQELKDSTKRREPMGYGGMMGSGSGMMGGR